MKINITPKELALIVDMADEISAMMGSDHEESNKAWNIYVKNVDKVLKKNNLPPRIYN